jgi:hypothetical protein
MTNYKHVFQPAFKNFDGFSTTGPYPTSSVQRVYKEAYLSNSSWFLPLAPFNDLIKAGTFVSSHCLRADKPNSKRDSIVRAIRTGGFRIDGLGNCLRTNEKDGVKLEVTPDTDTNLILKRKAIGKYLFNMAFENVIEPGYVTEKVFDALLSGNEL